MSIITKQQHITTRQVLLSNMLTKKTCLHVYAESTDLVIIIIIIIIGGGGGGGPRYRVR